MVEIRLLGRFAVLRDGAEVPPTAFGGRKVRSLVKVLASQQGRFVSNDVLASALWPDRLPNDPVANLQVLVNRARRALGDADLVVTGQGGYTLTDGPRCVVDAHAFLAAAGQASELTQMSEALAWWRGDPLPEEAYDDWAAEFRDHLLQARQHLLERAAAAALEAGDAETAVELAGRAVEAEPLRETAIVLMIKAHALAGDGAAALTAYDGYRRLLAAELGVDPSPEAADLYQGLLTRLPARASSVQPRSGRGLGDLAFVGREQERQYLRRTLADVPRHGTVVVVSGVSGSGKSRLLDELSRDIPMIRARAYLAESAEPWSLLRSLLREVLARDIGYLAGMPRPLTSALTWLVPEVDAEPHTPDPESRRALLQEVALRLVDLVDAVVVVDDLQWCDPSSLEVLEAVVQRGSGRGVLLAYRPDEATERADVAEFLARRDVSLRANLGGLSESELGRLVDDERVVEAIAHHTDRTPMAVSEVLRALVAEGLAAPAGGRVLSVSPKAAERAALLAGEGQRTAIRSRVQAQPEPDRHTLALLALIARESSTRLLAEATASTEGEVLDSLARLLRRDLVRLGEHGWATSHDMVNEVVIGLLDDADRVRWHGSLARALEADDDLASVAHHLRQAGESERAAAVYARAAEQALDAFADDEAAQLAEAGLALSPRGVVRAALHETRGEARHRRGDIAGARKDLQDAMAVWPPGPDHSRLLARLAMLALGADDIVRGAQLAELSVAEAGEDAPTRARALEVASILDMNLDAPERAAERAAEALGLYERLGDSGGMARIADARAMAQFLDGRIAEGGAALRRAADLFEDAGDLVRVVTPRSTGGHALSFGGRADEGLLLVTAARELARQLGHAEGQAFAGWHRAEVLAALGRLDEAAADAAEVLEIATRIGHRGWTATAWRAVGIAAQGTGDLDAALEAFARSLELSDNLGLFTSWASARIALVHVASGRAAEASPYVERALAEGPPLGHYEARWAQVEVAVSLGDSRAGELSRRAIELMDAGGMRLGRDRITTLAAVSESR